MRKSQFFLSKMSNKRHKKGKNQHPYYQGNMSETCFFLSLVNWTWLGVCGTQGRHKWAQTWVVWQPTCVWEIFQRRGAPSSQEMAHSWREAPTSWEVAPSHPSSLVMVAFHLSPLEWWHSFLHPHAWSLLGKCAPPPWEVHPPLAI